MELISQCAIKDDFINVLTTNKKVILKDNPQNQQTKILDMFNKIKLDTSWAFEESSRKDTSYATHGYHRYPAKFIPQLARRCINEYTKKNDLVCDPFMGCGTTLIESIISERNAVGVDINPVACLITKSKTLSINPIKLKKELDQVLSDITDYIHSNKKGQKTLSNAEVKPIIPRNDRIDYWFPNQDVKEELGVILGRINNIQEENIRNFCLCAFSNVLKNSSIWLMKSIKPTRDLNKESSSPYKAFSRQVKMMLRGNEEFYNLTKNSLNNKIIAKRQDARNLPCESSSVSLIVTSPPYVTSYEYADLHQLTALWLEYTKSVGEFREGFIGSTHKKEFDHNGIKSILAKQEIEELSKKSKREAESVRNYFFEMQQCFEEMHRVLKPNGKACIVIGNTALKKVPILNGEVFVEIMLNLGFKVNNIIKRAIPSKILPQTRDSATGKFIANHKSDRLSYAFEYILVMDKI